MNALSKGMWASNDYLKTMSVSELKQEFFRAVSYTAEGMRRMAELWVELTVRGEDMSAFHNPVTSYLPFVANGSLRPDLLVRYAGHTALLDKIRKMSAAAQAEIAAEGARIAVVTHVRPDEPPVTRNMRPIEMTVAQVDMVFGDNRIRSPEEQKKHFKPAPVRQVKPVAADDGAKLLDMLGLTRGQREDLVAASAKVGCSPAEFIIRALISRKLIRA